MGDQSKPLAWLHGEVKTPPFSQEVRIEAGLESKGWKIGTVSDFLELTPERQNWSFCKTVKSF